MLIIGVKCITSWCN